MRQVSKARECGLRRLGMEQLERRIVLAVFNFDFAEGDGGFTSEGRRGGIPWSHSGGRWRTHTELESDSFLIAPAVTADGTTVTLTMEHAYNFLTIDAQRFLNGGILEVSINDEAFVHITPDGGYPGDAFAIAGCEATTPRFSADDGCFGGNSGGRVTDTATLEVDAGATVQFRLKASWEQQQAFRFATWEVFSIGIDTGGAAAEASVVGRNVFYNNSFFDVDDAPGTASGTDDGALATDKVALLPGETATFANYTSYSLGLNGLMIDIADLASEPTPETVGSFFEFSVGNDDSPEDWEAAPAPVEVSVRLGEGMDGSDRVTVIWPDNALQNTWLQTTVLANADTGLAEPDVSYFGNAIGDSGNSAVDASVNAQDIGGARDNPHNFLNRALVDDAFDYNRDSLVNAQDIGIARDNPTNFLSDLNLITVPAAAPLAGDAGDTVAPAAVIAVATSLSDNSGTRDAGLTITFGNVALTHSVSSSERVPSRPQDGEFAAGLDLSDLLTEDDLIDLLAENSWSPQE